MNLSIRATEFFNKQEFRQDSVKSRDIIIKAFEIKGMLLTSELLKFQLKYGGLMIYAGSEPICFGIIHGNLIRGPEFKQEKQLIHQILPVEPKEDIPSYSFVCADTMYQEFYMIDVNGKYYEGYDLKANNFGYILEDLALFDEIKNSGVRSVFKTQLLDGNLNYGPFIQEYNLLPYEEFPVDLIEWYRNDKFVVRVSRTDLTLFSKIELNKAEVFKMKSILGI